MKIKEVDTINEAPREIPQAVKDMKARREKLKQTSLANRQAAGSADQPTEPQPTNAPTASAQQPVSVSGMPSPPSAPGFLKGLAQGLAPNATKAWDDAQDRQRAAAIPTINKIEPTVGPDSASGGAPSASANAAAPAAGASANQSPASAQAAHSAPTAPAGTGNSVFSNPELFKTEWEKYVAAKAPNGNYHLISDPDMLNLLKDMWMYSGGIEVKESHDFELVAKRNQLIESIVRREPIFESCYRAARYLSEAQLTQDQIQQIFKMVADGAAQGMNSDSGQAGSASNRTFLGKGADVVSSAWNKVKTAISQSGPVSGFDVLVDKLQGDIIQATGGKDSAISKTLQAYREFGLKHPIMQGAIYAVFTAAAATALGVTGPAGLAALAGGLRTADRLLQGDKFSTALWRGFKAGALSYLVGSLLQGSSDTSSAPAPAPGPAPDVTPLPVTDPTMYVAQPGDTLSQIADRFGTTVEEIAKLNPDIANVHKILSGQHINLPPNIHAPNPYGFDPNYLGLDRTAAQSINPYSVRESKNPWIDHKKTAQVRKLIESRGQKFSSVYITAEAREYLFQQVVAEGVFSSIKNAVKSGWNSATNKITYDKLDMNWRRNYGDNKTQGPVDLEEVKAFLRKMGVTDALINYALSQMQLDQTANGAQSSAAGNPGQQSQAVSVFSDVDQLTAKWSQIKKSGGKIPHPVMAQIGDLLKTALSTVREQVEILEFRKTIQEMVHR